MASYIGSLTASEQNVEALPQVSCSEYISNTFETSNAISLNAAQDKVQSIVQKWNFMYVPCASIASAAVLSSIITHALELKTISKAGKIPSIAYFRAVVRVILFATLLALPFSIYYAYMAMNAMDLRFQTYMFCLRVLNLDTSAIPSVRSGATTISFSDSVDNSMSLVRTTNIMFAILSGLITLVVLSSGSISEYMDGDNKTPSKDVKSYLLGNWGDDIKPLTPPVAPSGPSKQAESSASNLPKQAVAMLPPGILRKQA